MTTHEILEREEQAKPVSNRTFGLVFCAFFLFIGLAPMLRHGVWRRWAVVVAGGVLSVALIFPALLGPINRLWTRLGWVLHRLLTLVMLGGTFFSVMTALGWTFRRMGRDVLKMRFDPAADSYWIRRDPPGPTPESMRHLF